MKNSKNKGTAPSCAARTGDNPTAQTNSTQAASLFPQILLAAPPTQQTLIKPSFFKPIGPGPAERALLKKEGINNYLEPDDLTYYNDLTRYQKGQFTGTPTLFVAGRQLPLEPPENSWLASAGINAASIISRKYGTITDSESDRQTLELLRVSPPPCRFRRAILAHKQHSRCWSSESKEFTCQHSFDLIFPDHPLDESGHPIRGWRGDWPDGAWRLDILDYTYDLLDYGHSTTYRGGCWFTQDLESGDSLSARGLAVANMQGLKGNRHQLLDMLEATELFAEMKAEPKIYVLNANWREAPGYYKSLRILMDLLDPHGDSTYIVQLSQWSDLPGQTLADAFRCGFTLPELFARVSSLNDIDAVTLTVAE